MSADRLLRASAVTRCMKVDYFQTATRDGFSGYDVTSEEIVMLAGESKHTGRRSPGGLESSTTVMLAAAPTFF